MSANWCKCLNIQHLHRARLTFTFRKGPLWPARAAPLIAGQGLAISRVDGHCAIRPPQFRQVTFSPTGGVVSWRTSAICSLNTESMRNRSTSCDADTILRQTSKGAQRHLGASTISAYSVGESAIQRFLLPFVSSFPCLFYHPHVP